MVGFIKHTEDLFLSFFWMVKFRKMFSEKTSIAIYNVDHFLDIGCSDVLSEKAREPL